jgi:cellulose synthase/poly-beta-1,6-N-acetylglucosamine synthase-like glycosyltransferase
MFKGPRVTEPESSQTRAGGASRLAVSNISPKLPEPELRRRELMISAPSAPAGPGNVLPAEIGFLAHYGVPQGVLMAAEARAKSLGVSAESVLLSEGDVSEVHFYSSLARHLCLSYVDGPLRLGPQAAFPDTIHAGLAAIETLDGQAYLAAPRGATIGYLIARLRRNESLPPSPQGPAHNRMDLSRLAITTPTHLSRLVRVREREKVADLASSGLPTFDPALSARGGASPAQIAVACLGFVTAIILMFAAPHAAALLASLTLCASFLAGVVMRLLASAAALGSAVPRRLAVEVARLPVYSIIVAMYREVPVVAQLIAALDRIDYPRAKLEIKIVVEADDADTYAALQAHCRSSCYEIIVAPPGLPRTKPRALNVALPLLRGEYAAVFDAEDIPDPAQIRMAAERFAAAPKTLACLQASLVIDNEDGWPPRLFALEYAALFDVLNVGLGDLGWPFPLGGSSNHFRISALRDVHGWDAWNVTEDADLGFRLARFGYRAETLNSTTREEAPAELNAWFRQRRRWFKGFYQTSITLARDPARLVGEFGFGRTLIVWAILSASVLAPLVWPFFTGLLVYEMGSHGWPQPESPLAMANATLWVFVALAGPPALFWPILLGMKRRRLADLWPTLPLLFPYYLLIAAAAWTALYDLATKPHHWFKTEHGFARSSRRGAMVFARNPAQAAGRNERAVMGDP